jgi:plasmid stabilization system protein ParE
VHEVSYFEHALPGKGREFRQAVQIVFDRIKRFPLHGRLDEGGARRMRVKGFPFSVIYREEHNEIVVYAVRPDRKEPGYWLPRLR